MKDLSLANGKVKMPRGRAEITVSAKPFLVKTPAWRLDLGESLTQPRTVFSLGPILASSSWKNKKRNLPLLPRTTKLAWGRSGSQFCFEELGRTLNGCLFGKAVDNGVKTMVFNQIRPWNGDKKGGAARKAEARDTCPETDSNSDLWTKSFGFATNCAKSRIRRKCDPKQIVNQFLQDMTIEVWPD